LKKKSIKEVDRCFRGVYFLHHQGDETSVHFNETTRRYIPDCCHLQSISTNYIISFLLQHFRTQ